MGATRKEVNLSPRLCPIGSPLATVTIVTDGGLQSSLTAGYTVNGYGYSRFLLQVITVIDRRFTSFNGCGYSRILPQVITVIGFGLQP